MVDASINPKSHAIAARLWLIGRQCVEPFRITREEAKVGLWLLAICSFAYFVFIAHHPYHNHGFRLPWVPENDQLWAGRWFNLYLSQFNYGADIPVFLPIFGIVLGIFSAIFTFNTWSLKLIFTDKLIVGAAIVCFPATLSFFYYTYQTPLFFSGWFFACLAAFYTWRLTPASIVLGSVSILLCAASYQATLSVFATVVAGGAISALIARDQDGALTWGISEIFSRLAAAILVLASGLLMYWLSLRWLNVDLPAQASLNQLLELPERFLDTSSNAFRHLVLTQPELMTMQKRFLLIALAGAALASGAMVWRRPVRLALLIAFWVGIIIMTKFVYLIVTLNGNGFQYRYNTSLGFLHAFTFAVLLFTTNRWRPLFITCSVLVALIVMRFVQADLVRQEVLLRGMQHDLALSNRILMRIETLEDLDSTKTYDLVRIGTYPAFRTNLLRSRGRSYDELGDGHMDTGEVTAMWADEVVFTVLGASVNFERRFDGDFAQRQRFARENLLEGRQRWPHSSSVFIHEDTIYVYMR